jgi:ATP-dependent Clp protease ATP-binding subunit ClpC
VVSEKNSFASEILSKAKLTLEVLKPEIDSVNANHKVDHWKPVLSENLKTAIERSAIVASQFGYQFIGTEHFLYGLTSMQGNRAKVILSKLGLDANELEHNLLGMFENIARFPDTADGQANGQAPSKSVLEYFTSDLTKKAASGKVDPVIGRKAEIERLTSILGRRTKNNPVLIGEAGVGKTAIVEGLALAISKKEVPETLLDKKILSLDLASLVAGSMFRGEFENRLKQVIDEVKQDPNIILFIDEMHTMVGAGASQGSLDAANILKPALARGELRVIGATTLAEYKKYIEHDSALERRFQSILVEEPSEAESVLILKGLRENYEKHHRVTISDDAIESAVELSNRYIQDHHLPDKAVDLIDETAAFLRSLMTASKSLKQKRKLEEDLQVLEEEKTKAVWKGDFVSAEHLKLQEELLNRQLQELEAEVKREDSLPLREITSEDIAHTVSLMTKIPLERLTKTDISKLSRLEEILKRHIVGQDEAIGEVAKAIRRSRAGLHDPKRPLGSFIFLGPTGVGKTETAKIIAREVYDDPDALVRVDMSEFMERFNVSRLVGAPAGYVGYEEGGKLTEAVRRKPYSVVLFDELEKANPDVFNILLQILEEGQLTDAQGKVVSFRNTIVIMTSNLGMQELTAGAAKIGFADNQSGLTKGNLPTSKELEEEYNRLQEGVQKQVKEFFKPEFVNRIDKILVFRPLGLPELRKIASLQLFELAGRLKKQGITFRPSALLAKHIAEKSFDPLQGARFIRKNIENFLEDPLAEKIISQGLGEGSTVNADVDKETIVFSTTKATRALTVTV